ncbi:hypothetical protein [Rhodoferax sp. GW822-FHT02A01]|uniref:hypothetical protein n=1 Tax=Rhodoferax sp. GW822-FHT02A01 TaxID=3141537 RepID=UPI00315D4A89
MKSSTSSLPQKQRSTSVGMLVGTRFQPDLLSAIDEWRKQQPDIPTRPEAVRRLVDAGLRQAGKSAANVAKNELLAISDLSGDQL